MTKYEFLQKLQRELSGKINVSAVQDQIDYYSQYIDGEVLSGKSEQEVVAELGDPWIIAKTILGASDNEEFAKTNTSYEAKRTSGNEKKNQEQNARIHVFGFDSWWKKLLLILGIIGIVMVVVGVIGGIISILAPIIIPVFVIMFIIRIVNSRKR